MATATKPVEMAPIQDGTDMDTAPQAATDVPAGALQFASLSSLASVRPKTVSDWAMYQDATVAILSVSERTVGEGEKARKELLVTVQRVEDGAIVGPISDALVVPPKSVGKVKRALGALQPNQTMTATVKAGKRGFTFE